MQILRARRRLARPLFAVAASCFLFVVAFLVARPVAAQQPYRILDRWKLADNGGWDYLLVDSPAHRLYITRGDHVDVVDTTSGQLTGTISGLKGTHGVALNPDGKLGYISDGRGNAIVVFHRSTLDIVATIPVGKNPDAIIYEPATKSVWTFNGGSNNISVIDAATQKVVATIDVPGKPEFAAADGKGTVFNNIEDKNEIIRIDAHSKTITATWPACESPSGLAFDIPGHRLFPVCDGKKMAVLDSNTGKTIATAAIGDGPDAAGWDAAHKLAFASSGDGILTVVDASSTDYKTIESLPTQQSARTMIYDPATDRIYTVAAQFGPRPAATPENPRGRPTIVPDSFTILVIGR
jgi:YVTN family beta-propeller protein